MSAGKLGGTWSFEALRCSLVLHRRKAPWLFCMSSFFAGWRLKAIWAGFLNERLLRFLVWESVTRVSGVSERRGTFHNSRCE